MNTMAVLPESSDSGYLTVGTQTDLMCSCNSHSVHEGLDARRSGNVVIGPPSYVCQLGFSGESDLEVYTREVTVHTCLTYVSIELFFGPHRCGHLESYVRLEILGSEPDGNIAL